MKKWISLILVLALTLSLGITCPAAGEGIENVKNGDFETVKNDAPSSWQIFGGEFGKDAVVVTEDAASGEKAIKIAHESADIYLKQAVKIKGGENYTLTFKVKTVKEGSHASVDLNFYEKDAAGKWRGLSDLAISEKIEATEEKELVIGEWEERSVSFTAGETVEEVNLLVRIYGGGEYHFDAVSLMSPPEPEKDPIANEELLPTVGDAGNMLTNPGFEELDGSGAIVDWKPIQNVWKDNPYISIDTEVKYEGERSVKIETGSGGSPWVSQGVKVEPNTTYQASAWVRQQGMDATGRNACFKIEFYTDFEDRSSATYLGEESIQTFNIAPPNTSQWQQTQLTFETPDEAEAIVIYCRLIASAGTVWFDNVEFRQVSEVGKMMFNVDQYFYYPTIETGYARLEVSRPFKEELADSLADFTLYAPDKTTVLKEQKNTKLTDGAAYFDFPVSLLAEKKTAYWIKGTLKDAAGNVLETGEHDIYCYDRPSILDEEGNWYIDGEIFRGTVGYHIGTQYHETAKNLGMNIITVGIGGAAAFLQDESVLTNMLDDLHAKGLKGVVGLYPYMKPASHPENVESTKAVVAKMKDHPAVYGWMVQDEAFMQIPNAEYWLKEAYKIIRDIDDKHPVYVLEACGTKLDTVAKVCDVLVCDPYPSRTMHAAPQPGDMTALMRRTTERYGKPTMAVHQAFTYAGFTPTTADLRSEWYQGLREGVHYNGWYELTGTTGILSNEEWMAYLTEFAKEEQPLSYELFGRASACPVFNTYESDKEEYISVVKDGDLYVLAMNITPETREVTIPLKSQNGLVTVSGTPEEMFPIGAGVNPVVEGGNLKVTLPDSNVALIRFAGANIDPAALTADSFADVAGYEWAADAIEEMYREDIVNAKGDRAYDPSAPITRGEFAKALIRALDLELIRTEQKVNEPFTNVSEDAHYYKEVKTGQYFNILRGLGDNTFNPDAPITRQDLMVICARGLHEAMKMGSASADLSAFSDNASVADYAQSAVAEMIEAGIIKGNADGTINPLGNTTRAEAAVIMQRIFNKK